MNEQMIMRFMILTNLARVLIRYQISDISQRDTKPVSEENERLVEELVDGDKVVHLFNYLDHVLHLSVPVYVSQAELAQLVVQSVVVVQFVMD